MTWPKTTLIALFAMTALAAGLAAKPSGSTSPASSSKKVEPVTLDGTVVPLNEALKPTGLAIDAEPIAKQVVLKGADGTITPLLSDDASRALFNDERLRHRRTEIKGRRHPGLPYLQVISFKIEENGRLRTPEYYCEICAIN